jgi:hypothetical protein
MCGGGGRVWRVGGVIAAQDVGKRVGQGEREIDMGGRMLFN